MAKGNRPTASRVSKISKISDLKIGDVYTASEYDTLLDKLGGANIQAKDVKSAKDFVNFLNREMVTRVFTAENYIDTKASELRGYTVFIPHENQKFRVVGNPMYDGALYKATYNKSIDGYQMIHRDQNPTRPLSTYDSDYMEYLNNAGFYLRSVTRNGVTYRGVITKKRKTATGRTRYDILK